MARVRPTFAAVLQSAPFAAVVVIGAAWAGLTAPTNLTLPWSELGRARPAAWEAYTWAAATLGLVSLPHGWTRSPGVSWGRRALHAAGLLGATGALGWSLTTPTKWTLNVVAPAAEGAVTAPFTGGERVVWTRRLAEGSQMHLTAELLANERVLAGLAAGMHEAEARAAVEAGVRNDTVVATQALVRRALWSVQRGATVATMYGRIGLLIVLPVGAVFVLLSAVPRAFAWLVRVPIWAIPVANGTSVVVATLAGLPDDLGLRVHAALVALAQLAVVALADRAATERP